MLEEIVSKLENLRQLLHETAITKGISHNDVLVISQKLDTVINEYHTMYHKIWYSLPNILDQKTAQYV